MDRIRRLGERSCRILVGFLLLVHPQCLKNTDSRTDTMASGNTLRVEDVARYITVRVASENTWGSGILVCEQNGTYIVATSQHLLSTGTSFNIETVDSRNHTAHVLDSSIRSLYDVGFLSFTEVENNYSTAQVDPDSDSVMDSNVYASGFPLDLESGRSDRLLVTEGEVEMVLTQPLFSGYQIGYTNSITQGMSGGPLLNRRGEVVGINGLRRFPLWGNPYVHQDGTEVSDADEETLRQLAWAIPISTVSSELRSNCSL